jgi:hypothetical protein
MLTTLIRRYRRLANGLIVASVIVVIITGGLSRIDWSRALEILGFALIAGVVTGAVIRFVVPSRVRFRAFRFLDSGVPGERRRKAKYDREERGS